MSYKLFRVPPVDVKRDLNLRFHPYLTPPLSVSDMLNPIEFSERLDAYDKFNHSALTYGGLLRQYDGKRRAICQLSREMGEIEKKMIDIHKQMEKEAKAVTNFVTLEDFVESKDETNLHDVVEGDDDFDEDESDVEPTRVVSHSSSSSSAVDRRFFLTEETEDKFHRTVTVRYAPVLVYSISGRSYSRGVRSRTYNVPVPCNLCDDTLILHKKCSNERCRYRICNDCFNHLEGTAELCPFCRAPYHLPPSEALSDLTVSPIAIPPPAVSRDNV